VMPHQIKNVTHHHYYMSRHSHLLSLIVKIWDKQLFKSPTTGFYYLVLIFPRKISQTFKTILFI